MNKDYYTQNPFGPTGFGTEADAGPLTGKGAPIAIIGETTVRFQEQQPSIIIGGAGAQKFTALGAYRLSHPSTSSFLVLDIGGQYMSTTWHYNLAAGRDAYACNVSNIGAYSEINHPINLLSILKDDNHLFDNTNKIVSMIITEDGVNGDNAWVGKTAKRWVKRLLIRRVLRSGGVNLAQLWDDINAVDSDDQVLMALGRSAEGMPYDVRTTFLEILTKKKGAQKEYGAVMAQIKHDLDWLSSPTVRESVSGDEDYLSYIADPNRKVGIYYVLEAGSEKQRMSLTRLFIGIGMLHCQRTGKGARPLFYLEEAATCGGAEFITQAVSQNRKFHDTTLVYQSTGQLLRHFGSAGAQEIIDSCGIQIYPGGGIRSIEGAGRLASAIGQTTIHIDNAMAQADRDHSAERAVLDALRNGGNLIETALEYQHGRQQATTQTQAGRYAIDPAEVLRLDKNKLIILAPGCGMPPLLCDKLPDYWTNSAMAGRYGPDPLFPPLDRVSIKRRFFPGSKTRRFVRTSVPAHLAHMPNHINGEVAYVSGYRTW